MGWLNGWNYRKSHEIDGSSAGAQTDYQKRIKVHYGSGSDGDDDVYCSSHCKTDFGDIRFTKSDETSLLDYWIEKQVNSDYADIWVEVDSVPASPSSATIYIYYGKGDATTTSDGEDTFIFFDGFPGDSLDLNKWDVIEGAPSVADGILTLSASTHIETDNEWNVNHAYRIRTRSNDGYADRGWMGGYGGAGSGFFFWRFLNWGDTKAGTESNDGVASEKNDDMEVGSILVLRVFEGQRTAANVYFTIDDVLKATHAVRRPTGTLSASIRCWLGTTYNDWALVRKFVDPEPIHGDWGVEESIVIPTVTTQDATDIGVV